MPQDDIAGHMAVGVIDGLEVVDVDQRDGPAALLTLAPLEFDFQGVLPGAMVQ
ncbi:hypothetical protein D3C84_213830 [compost metagenome]